ncbi:hypothetical protein Gpo141_00001862 [Globisporangium polare]
MAFLLDEEDAYEDALIDEFDAPDALPQHDAMARQSPVQKQLPPPAPFVSAQSLRHQPVYLEHAPVAHAQSAGALYPSFQELSGHVGVGHGASSFESSFGTSVTQPPLPPQQLVEPRYPSVEFIARQREAIEKTVSVRAPYQDTAARDVHTVKSSLPITEAPAHSADPPARLEPSRSTPSEPQKPVQAEPEALPMLSEQEFEAKQREIAQELKGYEQQLDYLAHALAGDTSHQKEERKRRELERQEREHQRLIAMENRVQHQIERAHEREQRRVKVLERAHRASRSLSPEMRKAESGDESEEMPHGDDYIQSHPCDLR